MSVASKNPFALLNDDTVEPAESKPAGKTATPGATTTRTGGDKTRGNRGRGAGPRGGRYYSRGGGKPATGDAADSEEPKENSGARFHTGENKEKRGRGRGRGRPYSDRHSRTDIIDSDKQVEAGWGANTGDAELKAETAGEADAEAEATGAAATEEGAAETTEKRVEEEDKTITLDEYLAKQVDSLSTLVGSVSVREANGGDESLFNEATKVIKDEEEYYVGKSKGGPKARTERKEKITIEIDGQFSDARERGRGGRGGRGGPRGRGDRGGPRRGRGGRGAGAEVNVDDQNHFPTLGA